MLTPEYLASDYCLHEMERAIARDPRFDRGAVVPVRRSVCSLPGVDPKRAPLYVDLADDQDDEQWNLALKACSADPGTSAPFWLAARDEIRLLLARGQSVNLVPD